MPESNDAMRNSYLILDEYMRFLDNTGGSKTPSLSLLDVGVEAAMDMAGFDQAMFLKRGGKYKWSKQAHSLEWWSLRLMSTIRIVCSKNILLLVIAWNNSHVLILNRE